MSITSNGEVKFSQIQRVFGGSYNNIQISKYYSNHTSNYTSNVAQLGQQIKISNFRGRQAIGKIINTPDFYGIFGSSNSNMVLITKNNWEINFINEISNPINPGNGMACILTNPQNRYNISNIGFFLVNKSAPDVNNYKGFKIDIVIYMPYVYNLYQIEFYGISGLYDEAANAKDVVVSGYNSNIEISSTEIFNFELPKNASWNSSKRYTAVSSKSCDIIYIRIKTNWGHKNTGISSISLFEKYT